MSDITSQKNASIVDITKHFSWLDKEFSSLIKDVCSEFWRITPSIRLFSLEINSKNFFAGNEYFVTQAEISEIKYSIRLSETVCENFLITSLGSNDQKFFNLKSLTELEGNIIFKFNNILIKNLKKFFIDKKKINKMINNEVSFADCINLGFIVKAENELLEDGKIFISIPKNLINFPELAPLSGNFIDTTKFKKAQTLVDIYVGKTKLSLEDINGIEVEDIVVLEKSDIKKMSVVSPTKIDFNVNPDPRLFIDDDGDDDNDYEKEDIGVSTKDIWDNVQVDVSAKFPKVKMSLGELREMTEGVVMELDSVYGNEVVLEVENKKVAKGELVIVGYKYGVKITEICTNLEEDDEASSSDSIIDNDNDDFDVKDFEIEE